MKAKGAVLKIGAGELGLTLICLLGLWGLFALRSGVTAGATEGIALCGRVVIPALFPFMFLADFIGRSGASRVLGRLVSPVFKPLFGVRGRAAAAVLLSFLSGYPVSARLISALYEEGEIGREDAHRLMRFCVNPGPGFCVSAVGAAVLGSPKAGVILLASVALASVLVGVLFGRPAHGARPEGVDTAAELPAAEAFCEACNFSAAAVGSVCAYTILFSALMGAVQSLPGALTRVRLLLPLLEITSGVCRLGHYPLPLFAAFISFGGFSVLFQLVWLGKGLGIGLPRLLLWRGLCAALSAGLCRLLLLLFPVELPLLPTLSAALSSGGGNISASACLLFSVLVFLGYVYGIIMPKNKII